MTEDLHNEISAINSIYGETTLRPSSPTASSGIYILRIPSHTVTLRLRFPPTYPADRVQILGTESIGSGAKKGEGSQVLQRAREVLGRIWKDGEVCVFDLISELETSVGGGEVQGEEEEEEEEDVNDDDDGLLPQERRHLSNGAFPHLPEAARVPPPGPDWAISHPTTEKKSLFIARACSVASPAQAHAYLSHLLTVDKKLAKATHNITAYRIRSSKYSNDHDETPRDAAASSRDRREIVYQDSNDDGETAAGSRLLHLMQIMDVWDVLVVVSRWYGGVKLGPDRSRIINSLAREVLVGRGWAGSASEERRERKLDRGD
ncbi:eIF2 kinase Gcn2p negative regulator [Loxospora ochrophaea]|nr:eIF2 kinase Gcn2p negative regulator [Loxospora ochrophaea]